MKSILTGLVVVTGIGLASAPGSAAPFFAATEPTASTAIEAQWGESRCRRLRRACVNKDARGERGEGNCRRYRRACQRWWN
jgi:hypothetical protein